MSYLRHNNMPLEGQRQQEQGQRTGLIQRVSCSPFQFLLLANPLDIEIALSPSYSSHLRGKLLTLSQAGEFALLLQDMCGVDGLVDLLDALDDYIPLKHA